MFSAVRASRTRSMVTNREIANGFGLLFLRFRGSCRLANELLALPPASFERQGQDSNTMRSLGSRLATCLDTALLFAAAIEQMGIHPLLVLTKGHAFAGFWLRPKEFADVAIRRRFFTPQAYPAPRRGRGFRDDAGHPGSSRRLSASNQRRQWSLEPSNDGDFEVVVDIRRARLQHIRPLPSVLPPEANSEA